MLRRRLKKILNGMGASDTDSRAQAEKSLKELYTRYDQHERGHVLEVLSELPSREAAQGFVVLLETCGWPEEWYAELTDGFRRRPRHPDILFPALFGCMEEPQREHEVLRLFLDYCRAGAVAPPSLGGHVEQLLGRYREHKEVLVPEQQNEGVGWMWDPGYHESRYQAALLLDIMGFTDAPETHGELLDALDYRDARLKTYAVLSLLRRGEEISQDVVERLAADHEMRMEVYHGLTELGKADLFPQAFFTQEAFAYTDMVMWLAHPSELAQVPDEIELMKTLSVDSNWPDGVIDYYVFRFRTHPPHDDAERGWMAGVSGPFARKSWPSTEASGGTFSQFEPWEGKTPEEHLALISAIVGG